MDLVVYSQSRSFTTFLNGHLELEFEFRSSYEAPAGDSTTLYLLHINGAELECYEWLLKNVSGKPLRVAVCSDLPNIREMLECVRLGAKAYCNSRMAALHYQQMLRLVSNDQSWFPPGMLDETFRLAYASANQPKTEKQLDMLTARERDIALAVAEGKSNRQIADLFAISEPTVKTHLTSIFKKLELRDRVGLVLYLKQA